MKAVVLAAVMSLAYLVLVTLAFRAARHTVLRARLMTRVFLLMLPLDVAAYYFTPDNLGFLPRRGLEPDHRVEVVFFLFLVCTCFLGGILQLYNLADRGFSLRLAMEIDRSKKGLTSNQVVESYSEGKGMNWMYQKRIDDLLRVELIQVQNDLVSATTKGRRVAAIFLWLRQFLRVAG